MNVEKEILEQLSFGLDLLNLAAHLSDASDQDVDELQDAVRAMRITARPPRLQ